MQRVLILRPDHDLSARLRATALAAGARAAGWTVVERDPGTRSPRRGLGRSPTVVVTVGAVRCPGGPSLRALVHVHDAGTDPAAPREAHLVVCADAATAALHAARGAAVVVVPTRIDTDAFEPPLAPRPHGAHSRVGWLGDAAATPGLLSLRAALGRLGHRRRFALDVSGASETVEVPGVVVRRRGPALPETIADVVRSVDVVLVTAGPSASAVALVAAACGVVPVATEGAAQDVVSCGLGARVTTDESLVLRLDALLADPEFRAAAAVRVRETVVRERRLQGHAGGLADILVRLIGAVR